MTPIDRITARQEAAGLSDSQLCRKAGVAANALRMARSRGNTPSLELMQAYAKALECSVADLIGEATVPGYRLVAYREIRASDLNPRKSFDPIAIAELADSIARHGIIENLTLRPVFSGQEEGGFEIVAGERRWRAIGALIKSGAWNPDEKNIPASIRQITTDAEHLALAVLENVQRENLQPIEEAEAFARLQAIDKEKWSPSKIAETIGKTTRHVQLRLELVNKLAPATKDALRAGEIKLAQARALTAAAPAEQEKILPAAKANARAATHDAIREAIRKPPAPGMVQGTPDQIGTPLFGQTRVTTITREQAEENTTRRAAEAKARVTIRRLRDLAYRLETEDLIRRMEHGTVKADFRSECDFLAELATRLAAALGEQEKAA